MDIYTGDHPPIIWKPYKLPLRHTQWVCKEWELLEKVGIISQCVSHWSSSIVIVPKKAKSGELHQTCLCVDYHALDSSLPPVVKAHAHSKPQGVLSFVPLPKIDGFCAMLNGSAVHSSLACTSGYHNIAFSPKVKKKSVL